MIFEGNLSVSLTAGAEPASFHPSKVGRGVASLSLSLLGLECPHAWGLWRLARTRFEVPPSTGLSIR